MDQSSPVEIPGARSFLLAPSRAAGQPYRILVATPRSERVPEGLPTLYLLDGGALFGMLVETLRMRRNRPAMTAIDEALVVGVAHAGADPWDRERRQADFAPISEEGGNHGFQRFLMDDLVPFVESRTGADPARRVLLGHSLAGSFVLENFVHDPFGFRGRVAISPSIWSRRSRLFEAAAALGQRLQGVGSPRDLFVSVAEYDQALAPWQRAAPDQDRLQRRREKRKMVDDAEAFCQVVSSAAGEAARVHFEIGSGEDHASVVPGALSRSLRHVIGGDAIP